MKVLWTPNAEKGYDEIIKHLAEKWSSKEINNFIEETRDFLSLLEKHPQILEPSVKRRNVYRGPMNRLTIITYRIKQRKGIIELLSVRSARKQPR